ncbi:MAG: polysaccharide pyruvyl transferase family protein [Lachnospiraceae bacterium]|nr:polysaccharide pyruvyl transferase family protein [Lachnospiraceae bacterium]
MKRIAKFTWLHNGNYGSTLQALALQRFLRDNEFDIIDIDYDASLKTKLLNWIKCKNSPKLFLGKFEEAKGRKAYSHPERFVERARRFDEFKKKNMKLSKLYRSPQELKVAVSDYDIFICGSDQIWSPALMNPVYYLDSVPNDKVKIAYAPSFGVIRTTEAKKRKIAGYLRSFKYLSVRETQGQELVKELIKREVPVQVDPTMLISKSQWAEYAGIPLKNEKYIFCYLLTPNPVYIKAVKKISKERGLPVIIIPTSKGPFETGFEEHVDAGPSEWLNYIQNADLICTDSFHGCIFSSIFEREFLLFKRFKDSDKKSENSRVYTLTKLLGVEDRLIDANNIDSLKELNPIDFEYLKNTIGFEAEKSGEWLLNILKTECK